MLTGSFNDVNDLAAEDSDVSALVAALKKVLQKHGAWWVTRIVAFVLGPYKSARFKEVLKIKEYSNPRFSSVPANLAGEEVELNPHISLQHRCLWQRDGKPVYLTAEPYDVNKEWLKALIAHCDAYDIDFQIDGESCYYPGKTIRILFKRGHMSQSDAFPGGE